jgi:anti-anti-sigma factor
VDMSDVEFMDCSALHVLLDVAHRTPGGVVVRRAPPIVRRLFTLTGAETAGITVEE